VRNVRDAWRQVLADSTAGQPTSGEPVDVHPENPVAHGGAWVPQAETRAAGSWTA
jgi:hypothetical protein